MADQVAEVAMSGGFRQVGPKGEAQLLTRDRLQPGGKTVEQEQTFVDAQEGPVQIGILAPNTTINDLARILQTLQVSARDIIAIIDMLAKQGALKAKVITQ